MEFGEKGYARGLVIAVYVGMLTGAIFWGLSADMLGRRYAFNISLFICSVAAIISGAMPNWGSLGFFISLVGFGAGGNLILDTTVFLEYLPGDKQWVLTFLACWWGLGQAITGFIAWGFMGECHIYSECPRLGRVSAFKGEVWWRRRMTTMVMADSFVPSAGEVELRFRGNLHARQQHGLEV